MELMVLTMVKCKLNDNTNVVDGVQVLLIIVNNVTDGQLRSQKVILSASTWFWNCSFSASTSAANVFDNITIKNSDFSNNLKKGMYFEKLSNALDR
jgi:hypothetical protein